MNINEPLPGRGLAIPFTKAANPKADLNEKDLRMPLANRIPDSIRNHFIAMCGEFVGTVLFLWFALSGAQVANSINSSAGLSVKETGSNPQQLQYIALSFGFSLAVNAWVFFRISGGLFNPAVTFGMCLIGALPWLRGSLLFVTQILGGIVASALVSCMFPGPLNVQTELGGGTSIVRGLFIEMFLTTQLIFTIFMLAAEKHKGTFIAPVGIGLALFIAELTGVFFTGGSLNPARSFGPAVVNRYFVGYHWIYWLGPILGSVVAAGFYKFIKVLEFETANPGQDEDLATTVEKRRALLIAAGINEHDAHQVALELSDPTAAEKEANNNGNANAAGMANGRGQNNHNSDLNGIYGTRFRGSKEDVNNGNSAPHRPGMNTTGSQLGRYSYLGRAGVRQQLNNASGTTTPERRDSPAMATNEQLYAPLAAGGDAPLGHMVAPVQRGQFSRTDSSNV